MQDNCKYPWLFEYDPETPLNFDDLYRHYSKWAKQVVFELLQFSGLPKTVNETFLKMVLFLNGKVTFFKTDDGELLALYGVPAEIRDVYYIPTGIIVNNPYFKIPKSYNLTRGVDCTVVYCTEPDKYTGGRNGGLYMLIHKISTMLADNDISINVAQKNTRLTNIIAADDTTTKKSVDLAMGQMYAGKPTICVQSTLVNTLQAVPISPNTSNSQYLIQLVELRQYILSQFFGTLGIYIHDNMKKERLISDEITDGDDMAYLNIQNIFACVQAGVNEVNAMFGTEIKVELNSLLVPEEPTTAEAAADQSDDQNGSSGEPEPDDTAAADDPPPVEEEPETEPEAEPEPEAVKVDVSVSVGDAAADQSDDQNGSSGEPEPDDMAAGDDPPPEEEPTAEPEPEAVKVDVSVSVGDAAADQSDDQNGSSGEPEPDNMAAGNDPPPEEENKND